MTAGHYKCTPQYFLVSSKAADISHEIGKILHWIDLGSHQELVICFFLEGEKKKNAHTHHYNNVKYFPLQEPFLAIQCLPLKNAAEVRQSCPSSRKHAALDHDTQGFLEASVVQEELKQGTLQQACS